MRYKQKLEKKVDRAIFLVNSCIARKLDWSEIKEIIEDAKEEKNVVATSIKELKLGKNQIVMLLE